MHTKKLAEQRDVRGWEVTPVEHLEQRLVQRDVRGWEESRQCIVTCGAGKIPGGAGLVQGQRAS